MSRFYKNQGDFVPEKLVPRPPEETDNWKPVTLSEDTFNAHTPEAEIQTTGESPPIHDDNVPPEADKVNHPGTIPEAPTQPDEQQAREETPAVTEPPPPPPDIDLIKEEAYLAGITEGKRLAEIDFGSGTKALTQACELLNGIRETILQNSKVEMIDLVIALAEKIIRRSVTEQDHTILATVEDAITQAVKSSEFYVYLHPDDMEIITQRSAELVSKVSGLEKIVIKTEPSIERGGCKVESDNCTVDATISTQFDLIQKRIQGQD